MTGTLLAMPVLRAVDASGVPISGALLQFYATTTTTPASVYTSSTLGVALSNPVVADSGGLFVPIYLDPAVTYRMILKTAAGVSLQDIDPVSLNVPEASQAQVNAGVATGVYVSPAKLAAWSGVATALGYTPLNKAGDTATNLILAFSSLNVKSAGYLGVPVNIQTAGYTLALSDAGGLVLMNSASATVLTIPPSGTVAFPQGTIITLRNTLAGGTSTVTRGSGVVLFKTLSNTSVDVTLAPGGWATLLLESSNWVIAGIGVT